MEKEQKMIQELSSITLKLGKNSKILQLRKERLEERK